MDQIWCGVEHILKNPRRLLFVLPCVLTLTQAFLGCAGSFHAEDFGPDAYMISGYVHRLDIEGGCWQFTSDGMENFELAGPKTAPLLREGVSAKLIVRDISDAASICMIGKIVEVLQIIDISK